MELLLNPRVSWLCFLQRLLPFAGIFPAGSQENAAPCSPAETARERNRQAERLLDTYGSHILRLAYSYLHNSGDAEDVLQDTLIQFLRTKPVFESGTQEKAWLLRVAANCAQDLFRAPWRKRERPIEEAERVPAPGQVPEPGGVLEAVLSLPESYRLPVHLFYYEGLSIREIAGVLGKREGAVRTSLTRARALLRDKLKEEGDYV